MNKLLIKIYSFLWELFEKISNYFELKFINAVIKEIRKEIND